MERLAALVAALVLSASLALAAPPRFDASVQSDALATAPGGSAATVLYLNNSGATAITARVFVDEAAGLAVTLNATVPILPGSQAKDDIRIDAPANATLGPHVVRIGAEEWSAEFGAASDATFVNITITLEPPAPPPGGNLTSPTLRAPLLSPTNATLRAQPGASASARFVVGNPDPAPRNVTTQLVLPTGWSGEASPRTLALPASGNATVTVLVTPNASATNASGWLFVDNASAGLALVVLAPDNTTPPPPTTTTPPPPVAPTPGPTPTKATTTPPPTPPPSPPTLPRSSAPPPSAAATMRVEPAIIGIAPGGRGNATLIVDAPNQSDVDITILAVLPDGYSSTLDATQPVKLRAGSELRVPFTVKDAYGRPVGEQDNARVMANDTAVTPAAFLLRIERPTDATQAALARPAAASERSLLPLTLAAAGGAAIATAALVATRRRWLLAAALLYTRLRPARLTENPVRRRILDELRARPGLSYGELQRALSVANGVVAHHTQILERMGAIVSLPHGQQRLFYLAGAPRPPPREHVPERAERLLRERGPMTQAQLADALGVTRQTLHYHAKRMIASGLVQLREDGTLAAGEEAASAGGAPGR